MKRAGPRIDSDRVLRTAIRREIRFKPGDILAEDELTTLENTGNGSLDFVTKARILSLRSRYGIMNLQF